MRMKGTENGIEIEIVISEKAKQQKLKTGDAQDLEMIFTDVKGEIYQADVFLKEGWTPDDLSNIVQTSCLACDNIVKKCVATFKGKPILN